MQQVIDALVLGLIAFVIDLPWLTYTQPASSKMIQAIQGSGISLRLAPAAAVYVCIGILLSRARSPTDAAIIGSATYAVYDFTNYATLKAYDLQFAIIDIVWGGVLFGLTAIVASKIGAFRFRE